MSERERDRYKGGRHPPAPYTYDIFDRNSPRPPVPGEERVQCYSDWNEMDNRRSQRSASPTCKRSSHTDQLPLGYEIDPPYKSHSRPSSRHDRPPSSNDHPRTPTSENASPPACLRWAQSLNMLLEDREGVQLFHKYLESEGKPYADHLDFWFACEGLKKHTDSDMIQQLVKVIYKRFFSKSALPINEEIRKEVGRKVKSNPILEPPVQLFDEAQSQIEFLINNTTYPNFLKSDMYLQYVQSVQNQNGSSFEISSESSSSSSSLSTKDLLNMASGIGPLPIIHEDMEFIPATAPVTYAPGTGNMGTGYHTPNISNSNPPRLTKDLLLVTQKHRAMDVRPKHEAFVDKYMYRGQGAHIAYNSYNPVSRQDSELQSLSSHSDARTESDNMSYTDSSLDGRSLCRSSRRQARQARELASLNRETHLNQTVIPRTQRLLPTPLRPQDFAAILTEKLENVKREQESQEMLDRKLKEGDSMSSLDEKCRPSNVQTRDLANAIREKLQLEDDNDQDILDQHVSRVFSDLTPARSPGVTSPRPHSPVRHRWQGAYQRPRRKDKDGISTFSSDSGNVHDFGDPDHKMAMVKSKSMPEYAEERFIRGSTGRRSSSKKTLTDLTDSGVSVVSDTPPRGLQVKDHRVLEWLMDSDKTGRGAGHTHSEMAVRHRNPTSPNANRHKKGYGSRSNSLERNNARPAQPFVADPNMPPPPHPNTAVQLEEARRRLMEDDQRSRQRGYKHYPNVGLSKDSTLPKLRPMKPPAPLPVPPPEDVTTVVFQFCDEQFPYRTKIPGKQITLRQFKDYLPKKGNYRYFFKTECEELGNQVIQEEVSNDNDVIPLWEGKIMAKVKAID